MRSWPGRSSIHSSSACTRPEASNGFARLVTDFATFAWLCDVFVAAEHRGTGTGSFLVQTAVGHPDVAGIRQLLMATPGRSLYRRHGFGDLRSPERWMERPASKTAADAAPAEARLSRSAAATALD